MKSARQILLGGMFAAAVMAVAPSARAQIQTTGTPGSPSATTTIDGKQIPPPPLPFGGVIKEERHGFETVLAAARRAAKGRA